MQHVKFFKRGVAGFILGFGVLATGSAAAQDVIAVANGVNMWDGQWIMVGGGFWPSADFTDGLIDVRGPSRTFP